VNLRPALFSLLAAGSGCAGLNRTVRHDVAWEPPVYFEVARESAGLSLRVEQGAGGERWVSVVEQFQCIEEATQRGFEVEERKPKDWVLGFGAVATGLATSTAIGLLGGAITGGIVNDSRNGQQNAAGQAVGLGVGIAGTFGQLLASQKIIEGLNAIRFTRERPLTQELGRKVPCAEQVLQRLRLVELSVGGPEV
jgi:hypothetical protein